MPADEPAQRTPEQALPTGDGWKWFRRGCGCLTVAAGAACVLLCGVGWFAWDHVAERRERTAQVLREALADGDFDAAWANAAFEFRAKHSRDRLAELVQRHPDLLHGEGASWWKTETVVIAGTTCVVLGLTVADGVTTREIGVYCVEGPDGRLQWLGVWPDFEEAVPAELREALRRLLRSSHDWDD